MTAQNAVALVPRGTAEIVSMEEWTETRLDFIRKNYCGDAPPPIAEAFIQIARRRRLAPEEKQIYLIKRGDKWNIESSIDGFRLIADRSEVYAGSDEPVFTQTADDHPDTATVTVWKIVQGVRCPFTATVRWEEFRPKNDKQAFMWVQMPYHMLAKVCEAQALRKAFPADLSGIYVEEEMQQAGPKGGGAATVREVRAKPIPAKTSPPRGSSSPTGMATPNQIKAITDLGKRKRLGELDIEMLLGGNGWAERTTESDAADWIAWLGSATREQIDDSMAKAAEAYTAQETPDEAGVIES